MNDETVDALKGSIAKWQGIVDGTWIDEYELNCPLCELLDGCYECPVFLRTGFTSCFNSPYERWIRHHRAKHNKPFQPLTVLCDDCEKLAREELDFLRSLLLGDLCGKE